MDAANALYDGATETALLAARYTDRKEVLVARSVNEYRKVLYSDLNIQE